MYDGVQTMWLSQQEVDAMDKYEEEILKSDGEYDGIEVAKKKKKNDIFREVLEF